ncbi:MAG: hypothetical protein AABX05_02210 [Nanoarchaeota archaeon]
MDKLEQLTQGGFSQFFRADGTLLKGGNVYPVEKIRTIVVENSAFGVAKVLEEGAKKRSLSIPLLANAYVASEFNGGTQKIIRDEDGKEKMYSVYAVQFYFVRC